MVTNFIRLVLLGTITALLFTSTGIASEHDDRKKILPNSPQTQRKRLSSTNRSLSPAKFLEDLQSIPRLRYSGVNLGTLNPDEQSWLANAKKRAEERRAAIQRMQEERQSQLRRKRRR